jgi:8-hydroxy-5-deazaflavin:NADPH oxidoreductase
MTKAKIGVLGSGDVGRRLAGAFLSEGHEVMLGTRHPDKKEIVDWREQAGPEAKVGSFEDTAGFGDWVVLAVLGKAAVPLVESVAPKLEGKVLIDATNPLDFGDGSGPPSLFVAGDDSLGERVQKAAPKAKVVKAFNSIGNADMYKPELPGGPPTMFLCGDDAGAKEQVAGMLESFGHGPVDMGGIEASRYLEPLVMVWVRYGIATGGWRHGFKMLRMN